MDTEIGEGMINGNDTWHELNMLDREDLMARFAHELPGLGGEMGLTLAGLAFRTGLDEERVKLIVSGHRKMKWSEYLSLLFVLWDDERGRRAVEKKDLFPKALKRAMTIE